MRSFIERCVKAVTAAKVITGAGKAGITTDFAARWLGVDGEQEPSFAEMEGRQLLAGDLLCAINSPSNGFEVRTGVQYAGTLSAINRGDTLDSGSRTKVQLFLSSEAVYNANTVTAIAGANVTFIGTIFAGDTQQDTVTYIIPTSTAAGTYYLFAVVDGDRLVPESNEGNNISSGVSIQVAGSGGGGGGGGTEVPDVDLRTTVALVNTALIVNTPIMLNVTVTNTGPDALPLPGTFARVYMTRATTANPSVDRQVGEDLLNITLLKDQVTTYQVSLTIPEELSTGAYRFYAVIDGSNQTPETNETNNTSALVLGQFNYAVRDVTGTFVSTTLPSQWVERSKPARSPVVTFTVKNASDIVLSSKNSIGIRAFLRPVAATNETSDIAVSNVRSENLGGLAAQASRTRDLRVNIPTTLAIGDYRLVVKLDTANKLDEVNENNNTIDTGTIYSVVERTFNPGLVSAASAYPAAIRAGKSASVALNLNNTGNTRYQGNITFEFYFVDSLGIEVGTRTFTKRVDLRTDRNARVSGFSVRAPAELGGYAMGVRISVPATANDQSVLNNALDIGGVTVT